MSDTEYVILKNDSGEDDPLEWTLMRWINARSAESAIRAFVGSAESGDGRYVAVPARSWKPVTVKAETRTVLTLEQPT